MKFPFQIVEDAWYQHVIYADGKLLCRINEATAAEKRAIVAALNLLPVARDLIEEAMETHIYELHQEPEPDCQYAAFLREADAVLKEIEHA